MRNALTFAMIVAGFLVALWLNGLTVDSNDRLVVVPGNASSSR